MLSISLINAIIHRCGTIGEQTVSRLLENFEDLMIWFLAYLKSITKPLRPGVTPYATSSSDRNQSLNLHIAGISELVQADPRLKDAFINSPNGMRLLLTLWAFREQDGSRNLLLPDPEGFPILSLWGIFTIGQLDTEYSDRIFDAILSTKFELTRFCNAFIDRVRQIPLLHTLPAKVHGSGRRGYTSQTLRTIYALSFNILQRVSSHPVIQAPLRRLDYLSELAKALIAIHPSIPHDDSLTFCYTLHSCAASQEGENPISGAVKIVSEPGLVSIILDDLLNSGWDDDGAGEETGLGSIRSKAGAYIIAQWTGYALYPRFVRAFTTTLLQLDRKLVDSVMKIKNIGRDWAKLVDDLVNRLTFLDSNLTVHICDNFQCPHIPLQSPYIAKRTAGRPVPKSCSGCHSVIYCTPDCQKVDWKAKHKKECAVMRRSYLETLPAGRTLKRIESRVLVETLPQN
ncbi:hypothetical protein MD484_g5673, partial [Candolleomyces efflorescens]